MAFEGCPGSRMMELKSKEEPKGDDAGRRPSHLRQWPVQLNLVSPEAPYFQGADVLLSADCVAHALGDYHQDYLQGKALAIACPKLDAGQEEYVQKLKAMIDQAKINTLTVAIMQVPCCRGLLSLAEQAVEKAERKIPIKVVVVGVQGDIISENWV
ncbi:MAG TPA: 4Fe-4S ferredoxin [Bacillota bacterium]|nr:4Fe-4S ferredoxin [Bacillota bacterium]